MKNNYGDQLKDILDSDENVLWEGKPVFIPFIASGLPLLGFGILWGIMDYGIFSNSFTSSNPSFLIPFFLLHLAPLWMGIFNVIRLLFIFNNTLYASTNKRIILRTGFWGIDFKSIDYDKILDIRVDVNPFENMFRVGTIKINTGLTGNKGAPIYDSIGAIQNPYGVFKQIKTVSVNIKTDWNYPNKLRPSENPGYKTKYKPE
jgi:hypothetical protein